MKRFVLAALLLAAPAFAQPHQPTTRLVTLKYADPGSLLGVIRMFGVELSYTNKAVALRGEAENVNAAELAIKQLDVPAKTIELIVYFVVGSDQPNLTGAPVPAEVRDVIAQLKSTFTFKDYKMLDTLSLRTRAGSSAETSGILGSGVNPRLSQFSIRSASVNEDGAIRIDRMHAGLRTPVPTQTKIEYMSTGIDQDVDVKEGQKVVVGRASLEGPEKALFLILTARVVQ